jgi:PAS domain S-box-containing protein
MISALCVDDEQELLDLYKIFLEQSGEIQVDTADSVKMAVGKLKKFRYDIIISDYSMPECDGVAFLKCILPAYGDIPFILFTGKGREEVVIDALNNGARFYVQKGGDPKEQFGDLIHKIKHAVGLKKVEDALRDSEIRYRNLFETANYGILLLDADTGGIIDANVFLLTLIGSSLEEIRGKHLWDIGLFKDVALGKKAFLELQAKKNTRFESLPLMIKNGQEIVAEFVSNVYTVGQADVIQCNIRDITERKRAEEALRESEERYRNVVEDQTEFICRFLPDGTHVFVNDAYCRYFNKKREEIIGNRFKPVLHPEDREIVALHIASLTPQNPVMNIDQRIIMPDGIIRWQRWSDRAIFHADGSLNEYQSVGRDITDRKQDEEALHETNEYIQKLIDFANAPIIVWNPAFQITRFNHASEHLTGRTEQEVLGQKIDILFPKDSREASLALIKNTLEGERWEAVKIPILGSDGTIRIVLWNSANILTDDADLISSIAHGIDITEFERAEETIRSALAEKAMLLREIHHRVKNNIAEIISLIELKIISLTDPTQIHLLMDLESRIRSMALVHESLYLTEDLAWINIATYTENLIRSLFQVYGTGTDIRLRIEMGNITIPPESAIPCGLVMSEVVTNSLKYAFPKTFSCAEIRGEPCTIALTLHREGNDYLLKIADNGTGMPEGVDDTMSPSLGLYLIRIIVTHQLRGSLEISTAGGTAYTIRFPDPVAKEYHADE